MRTQMNKTWLALTTWLLVAGAGALLALAQQPPQEQQQGPLPPPPPQEEAPYALKVDVPIVNVDVTVVDKKGNFVTGLRKEHFRVFEDNQEQEIVAFAPTEAPLTTVLVVEASPLLGWWMQQDNLQAAYLFLRQLRKSDWVALVAYDMRPRLEVDFTQDQQEIVTALRHLQFPAGFSEVNMFDAIADTLDRMKEIDGKKSIVVIGTGLNTFGRHSWDDIQKIAREQHTTIFAVGMGWTLQLYYDRAEAYGRRVSIPRMELLTAEAQMRALAEQTGGRAYFPRFTGEIPGIYQEIGAMLRNQYSLAFRPKEFKRDGKYHKIKVELHGPDGQKLKVIDQDGKEVKYQLYAREGYYAPEA